jgi:hypothetical protein
VVFVQIIICANEHLPESALAHIGDVLNWFMFELAFVKLGV